ncbi:CNH domain-containing protein [Lentinula detonsa]|uniref:CNH domain-containing protein n=1 Tax=Lentinula detonsa TaxID=2804962 RepID=A0AA38PXJ3_9AGAR|nr:CNH domain-containing protein [Lentinula detonsa]
MPEPDPYYSNAGPSTIARRPTDVLRELKEGATYGRYYPEEGPDLDVDESNYDWDEDYSLQQQRFAADESYQSYSSSSRRNRKQRNRRDWTYEYSEGNDNEYSSDEFINYSLLSHLAIQLRDKVPRGFHVKASIPYEEAFTGKDIVDTVQSLIKKHLLLNHSLNLSNSSSFSSSLSVDRRAALHVARSLQSQLLFYEVDGGGKELSDGVEEVYMFFSEDNISSSPCGPVLPLPTAVMTMLTRCYSPTCVDDKPCYAWDCPKRGTNNVNGTIKRPSTFDAEKKPWKETVPLEVLSRLPEGEVKRQVVIHDLIEKETDYLANLIILETQFMLPFSEWIVNHSGPLTFSENGLDPDTISSSLPPTPSAATSAFGPSLSTRNSSSSSSSLLSTSTPLLSFAPALQTLLPLLQALITAQTRLLESLRVRARESQYDMKDSLGYSFPEIDLKKFTELLALPAQHLKSYTSLLSAVLAESSEENSDASYLREAIRAMRALWGYGKVKTFQLSMNVGAAIKWEWFDLVSEEERKEIGKTEMKRQAIIFELIKGEMAYVKDLENVEHMYITPLVKSSTSSTPIIPPTRLPQFISSVFNNIHSLHFHHLDLLQALFRIQYDEHPTIRTISAPLLDAALNWREAYMEYIPNYPIAAYTIDSEMRTNPAFKEFVQQCTRHPDAHRLDMKNFINRPIPRLLRYELLLKGILEETPVEYEDRTAIPQVLDVIRRLGKDTEPGVDNAKSKVELWRFNEGLVFKQGEWIDMDLLDENRSLIHSGKLLRQADGLEWNGWTELYVLLFDNYMVLTKPKEREDGTKYHVNRRPVPLDLLTIDSLTEPPVQRGTGPGLLRGLRSQGTVGLGLGGHETSAGSPNELLASPESNTPIETSSPSEISSSSSTRLLYPITLHHLGRLAPQSTATQPPKPSPNVILYAESAAARTEWGVKLQEALGIRRVVQESNKVFEIEMLSSDSFVTSAGVDGSGGGAGVLGLGYSSETLTGRVTCSVPFNTADGRGLVAVGCAEGVWIGFRHDPKSMRRVLHLKFVTQCAMLEDYGIFLVLADKSLFAYHIEALVPSSFQSATTSHVPQKLNGNKDVHFFTVGTLHGRTLVIYMKKKGLDSIFRVLEPVSEKIKERAKAPSSFGSRIFVRSAKSEWFKIYRDFFLPSESYDLIFLKATIAILCSRGFEIMDLNDFKSVTIPQRDDPRLAYLAKRCESCRPIGMFKSGEDEFLLCYNEFGVYVDKHGDPNRPSGTIEWEGTAERVAVHAPYVLLFDSRFIEIRHLENGRLAQIIPGNDIRCIWDGRGVSSLSPISPSAHNLSFPVPERSDEPLNQDAQVHAVMNAPDTGGGLRGRMVVQQVFELLPTVPLFLPDSPPNGSTRQSGGTGTSVIGSHSNTGSGSGSGSGRASGSGLSVGQASNTSPPPRSPPQLRNSPSWRS